MKEYKFAGRLTNENFQKALRSPEKATLVEAGASMLAIFAIEYVADTAWDGTRWIAKKIKNINKKKGGKK